VSLKEVWFHCGGCEGHCDGGIGPVLVETMDDLPPGAAYAHEADE
jgi:hypothetical protein